MLSPDYSIPRGKTLNKFLEKSTPYPRKSELKTGWTPLNDDLLAEGRKVESAQRPEYANF